MKLPFINVPFLLLAMTEASALVYTSYFYTTENVDPGDISCNKEHFGVTSESSCAHKCTELDCYRFREKNGVCSIVRRKTPSKSSSNEIAFKKVSLYPSKKDITPSVLQKCAHAILQRKILIVRQKKTFNESLAHCRSLGGT